ncbi:MAG: LURP-one-related family protein [Oscillospiraceae bacterium]|jgi:uncharacterized protein YxjI|nr:LURP-one-related family protein [Oscillospiraceae bacterium]
MKLYIKQKVFSWKDRFFVKDEWEADRYHVEGEFLTLGKKLHVFDANGAQVAFLHQKVFSLMPRYFIEIDRDTFELVKELTFLRPKFHITGLPLRLEGDFFAHDYALLDGDFSVMRLSKHWFTWGDSYELDIADPRNELLCLCVALAVDCALAQQE